MGDDELLRLRELEIELGADVILELVDLFLEDGDKQIIALGAALKAADGETLRRDAHSLKGSSSNLGFKTLSGCAAALERHARAEGCLGASPHLDALLREHEGLRPRLVALREALDAKTSA
ncbi:MAG: Hpt domain-containing protein [Deltaproteobacteria bacterium]|nr:Hpt domain-containing protein [Deltaproteobacteria bacterium]